MKIKVGDVIGGGLPLLEIHYRDPERNTDRIGYLSPFRGYKFQVSKTRKGDWDVASTDVVGLGNIILATENLPTPPNNPRLSIYASNIYYNNGDVARTVFKAMVFQTIAKLANRFGLIIDIDSVSDDRINTFCQMTYDYIKSLM